LRRSKKRTATLASQQLMALKREIRSEKGEDCAGCGKETSLQRRENLRLSEDGAKAGLSGELDPFVKLRRAQLRSKEMDILKGYLSACPEERKLDKGDKLP
jgi:hypothetical protein